MGDADFDLRHQFAEAIGNAIKIGDARADVKALATAEMLAHQRFARDHRVIRHDEGADGEAVNRGGRNDAHVAHPGQRHLQGARDRRRRQGENVNVGLQLFEALFVGNAEMLLFVHHK